MKVFSPFLNGNTTTSGSFNVPNHPSTASIQNPLTGSLFHDDTDGILKVYTGTQWAVVGEQTEPASGPASANIEYLVVAGGGGGGAGYSTSTIGGGGGGGAGGLLSSSLSSITSGSSITVSVGGGGTGQAIGSGNSTVGTDSSIISAAGTSFSTVTSNGGGRGGSYANTPTGGNGGSGGGSAYNNAAAGSGTVGQGNDGGRETTSSPGYGNGGGGGASQAGSDGTGNAGGDGGDGKQSNITGTATYYAGGGGGGIGDGDDGDGGAGGNGGGGTGGEENISGTAGTSNTGGGGGGGGNDGVGGSAVTSAGATGGSGVVIFAYPASSMSATGGVRTFFNDRVAHTFESSGTFSVGGIKTYTHNTLDIFGDSSCIALYNFNGNANDTGGNYNGTASNITYNQGYINDSAVFNGTSSVITLPSALSNGSTTDATCISFWFNVGAEITSATANNEIMNFAQSSGNFGKIALGSTTGNFGSETFSVTSDVTSQYTYSTTNIPAGWNHAVVQWNSSTTKWDIYINSSQHSTSTFGTNEQGKWALKFGNRSSLYYSGKLDQIRIFSKTLSTAEITTLYEE